MTEMHLPARIQPLQTARTLHLCGMKIVGAIEHQRVVIALVCPTGYGAFPLLRPTCAAPFFKQGGQQRPEQLWSDTIQNLAHLRVGGHLWHAKKRFQVAAPAALLHLPLKFQKAGVLKEQHGKPAQERIV